MYGSGPPFGPKHGRGGGRPPPQGSGGFGYGPSVPGTHPSIGIGPAGGGGYGPAGFMGPHEPVPNDYTQGYSGFEGGYAGGMGGYDGSVATVGWKGFSGGGVPPGIPSGRFSAVKLRGLPFGVREYEIAMFLGVDPVDIMMVQRNGRATGECFVVLCNPGELEVAMRKNKAYMGSRYIEVFEARKMDYYRAIAETYGSTASRSGRGPSSPRETRLDRETRDRSRSPPPRARDGGKVGGGSTAQHPAAGTSTIIKLRGLPFSAGPEEVVEFFADPSLGLGSMPTVDDVVIATGPDGRPSGMAFVEFTNPATADAAMGKDRHLMGSRYIELFLTTVDERARYLPVPVVSGPHLI